jgi:hypothetical protein
MSVVRSPRREFTEGHDRRRWPLLVTTSIVGLALSLAACDDSPTEPRQPPLLFTGTLTAEGRSSHAFEPQRSGTVSITLVDLTATLVDVTFPFDPATAIVGLGIGRPDGEGGCTITGQTTLGEGDRQLYGLNEREYCATLFDPGNFPDEATFSYQLRIELPD